MEEILKEWKESEACRRIATLESYCQAHGFEEFDGQSIPDWFKEKLVEFENKIREEQLRLWDVSSWSNYGKTQGYWAYFQKEVKEEEQKRIWDYLNEYYAEHDASVSKNLANIIFDKIPRKKA